MKKLVFILLWISFMSFDKAYGQNIEYDNGRTSFHYKEAHYAEFRYETSLIGVADSQEFYFMNFEVKLPLLLDDLICTTNIFRFFYKHNESIFISTPYLNSVLPEDAIYEPTFIEVFGLINSLLVNDEGDIPQSTKILRKFDRLESMKKNRRNLVIVKNGITIVLFNIKKENLQQYQELVLSVKLIDAKVSD